MNVDSSELKRKALLAKQRMRMGYWRQVAEQKEARLNKLGATESNKEIVSEIQRAEIRRETGIIVNNPLLNRDEALYKKVKKILDEDEYVSNPIGKLINKDEFDKLDENGKQRYVLQLGQKYRELRERYYKERQAGIN